ncbi:MAG: riboflavin synthase [Gammaproteobacteria bacterium]|nr:MAG: riboflavin synthase [Gammaproteobacteria bacterium]
MFTGIIESVGEISRLEAKGGDLQVQVSTGKLDLSDVKLGDSIATNGVCLTAVALPGNGFVADVSAETVRRSSFCHLRVGSRVNLEKALTPTTRLGGHLVSGHVDGVGEILSRTVDARSMHFQVSIPSGLGKYMAEKGSICVDGVSLTINDIESHCFHLNIVPHTALETTIPDWHLGAQVNLEVDVIARYLERLLMNEPAAQAKPASRIDEAFLAEHGFLKL